MPAGSWDCHCHVFGPADRFPYAEGRSYTPADSPAEQLFALHDRFGIEHAVLVQPAAHGTDHSALLAALRQSHGRYRGILLAGDDFAALDLEALHALGIRGIRLNLIARLGSLPEPAALQAMAEKIRPLGWHFLVHAEAGDLAAIRPLLGLGLPIAIDHMGRLDAAAGIDQPAMRVLFDLLSHPNCWIKLSAIDRASRRGFPYEDALPLAQKLFAAVPERSLWGTDFPHPNHADVPDDADLIATLPLLAPDAADRRRLLVENPSHLYA